jgi:ribose transport system ATP-binding protein
MTADTPLLEVRGIEKQYPGVRALKGVDFDVRAGEVHCLLGPNGAGKSTLIKCVSGVVAPTKGEILVEGARLPVGEPSQSMALGVGTIYQELDLVEDLRVVDSIFLGHEPRRFGLLDRAKMRSEATAILERLDHGDIKPDMFVRALRPAAQQVVSIARALSRNVRLLIMDEPSAILDDGEVETLFGVVRRLTADGVGVIYISHRLDEIPRIGDRVTVLSDGRTVATGLPADTPRAELVEKMVGRKVDQLYPHRARGTSETVVLDVRGVSGSPRVKECSFQVHAGEVLGIGGLVGAGRTELLRLVYGLDRPDTGEVHLDGKRLPAGRPDVAIGRGVGLAPEDRKSQGLLLAWSLAKNVTVSDLGRFTRGGLIGLKAEREAAGAKLRELNTVPDDPDRITRELSGGNQQKVVLARWLLRQCRVLLLDEPTRGVDVGAKAEIYRLIAELSAAGIAVVVVSSEMEELMGLSTRILIMRDGALVAELDGETATEVELLSHAVAPTHTDPVLEEST